MLTKFEKSKNNLYFAFSFPDGLVNIYDTNSLKVLKSL